MLINVPYADVILSASVGALDGEISALRRDIIPVDCLWYGLHYFLAAMGLNSFVTPFDYNICGRCISTSESKVHATVIEEFPEVPKLICLASPAGRI